MKGSCLLQRIDASFVSPQLSNDIQVLDPSLGTIELVDCSDPAIAMELTVEEFFVEGEWPGHDGDSSCRS